MGKSKHIDTDQTVFCIKVPYLLCALFFSVGLAILYTIPLSAEEQSSPTETKPPPRTGRPDHSAEISYTGFSPVFQSWQCSIDDKLPFSWNELISRNNFRAKRFVSKNPESVETLYSFQDTIMGQNNTSSYLVTGGINGDKKSLRIKNTELSLFGGITFFRSGNHRFVAGIFYSTENFLPLPFSIPIPIVSYEYRSPDLIILAGFPSMIMYHPIKQLTFTARYIPLHNIESSLIWRALPFISMGPVFSWKVEKYTIHSLPDDDHLYHETVQCVFRLQGYLSKNTGVQAEGGYIFSDHYFSGDSSLHPRHPTDREKGKICTIGFQFFW